MAENSLDPEPRPNPRDNEYENEEVVDEEGNVLNISQNSQLSNLGSTDVTDPARDIHPTRRLHHSAGR